MKYIKDKLSPSSIIVHGRSLGGQVAKFLSPSADVVVVDRTFSSISIFGYLTLGFIPKYVFGSFIQKVYDYFLDNYATYMTSFVKTDSNKIILYDPNVGLILTCLG